MTDRVELIILSDQKNYFQELRQRLQSEGYAVLDEYVTNLHDFSSLLSQRPDWDMVIYDDRLAGIKTKDVAALISGYAILVLPVVQISTSNDIRIAVRAMNDGANRFVPCDDLALLVETVLTLRRESRWWHNYAREEKETQEEAALYRGLLDIYPDMVGMVDLDERLIKVNPNVLRALRITSESEIIGHSIYDLIHPDDREETRGNTAKTIREGGLGPSDVRILRSDGTQFTLSFVNAVIRDRAGNPKAILWVGEDVTEKRVKDRELKGLEERFRKVFHSSPIAIGIASLKNDLIIDVNKSLCQLFGYTREDLIGKNIFDIGNASISTEVKIFNKCLKEHVPYSPREIKISRKDGQLISILVSIGYIELAGERCALAVISDISDRLRYEEEIRQLNENLELRVAERTRELETTNQHMQGEILQRELAEDALRQSEERYRILAENAHDAIFELTRDGIVMYINQYAAGMLGRGSPDVTGKKVIDLFMLEKGIQMTADIQRAFDTGLPDYSIDLFTFPSGNIWLSTWLVPLNDQNGKRYSVLGFSRDVSAQQQAEIELKQAYEQQKKLNDLKSSFIRRTSHEFRTPLYTILSSAELIEYYSKNWPEDKLKTHLHRIQETVKRMNGLLDDLLIIERAGMGRLHNVPTAINLVEFFNQVIYEIKDSDHEQHPVFFSYDGECAPAVLDESLLRQIVINLLVNAVKFSPTNTAVNLMLKCEDSHAIITIEDHGMGIPEQDQPYLFEHFFRGANTAYTPGSGLGLSIVKEAVEVMAGKINFSSQVGVGTVFTVELPLIQQPT